MEVLYFSKAVKVKKTFKLVWSPGVQGGVLLDRLVSILVSVQRLIGSSRVSATTLVDLLQIFAQTLPPAMENPTLILVMASSVLAMLAAVALLPFDPHPNHQHLSLLRLRRRFANPAFGSFVGTFHVRVRTFLLL